MKFDDLRYALRLLAKTPGFTMLTIGVMAAGIGLSVYLFSFLYSMTLKPLPFEDGDSLVLIDQSQNGVLLNGGGTIDLHDYSEIRTSIKGLSEIGAYYETNVNVSGQDGARRYYATVTEPNMFSITRTKPILGRVFSEEENIKGANNVVIIGYDLWQNNYAGDPEIINQSIRISGVTHQIIGVMPQGYFFPRSTDIWMPMREDSTKLERGKANSYSGFAHLDDGVTMQEINRQLTVIMKRMELQYPKTNTGISAYVTTFPMSTMGNGGNVFLLSMYTSAILLLLLASINVGNLLLSRAIERAKETAIRVALGAPRARLISQMLWESIIICSVGGFIGLLVAAWGLEITETITATFTDDKPFFWWKFGIDIYTIQIFFAIFISTIFITGFLPAWKNSNADFNAVLRDGTRGALGKKAGRLNRLLVISEVFLSMTILIAAGVMVIGTYFAVHTDYGADTDNVLTARVRLTQADYDTKEKLAQFAKTIQQRLENSVGIGEVMISSALPGQGTWNPTIAIDGNEYTDERNYPRANYIVNTVGSLGKLGVKLKQGRYFNSTDDGLNKSTIIVTESFVKSHFPNASPIGRRVRIVEIDGDEPHWLTIIGVVEHTIQGQSFGGRAHMPSIFRPVTQSPRYNLTIAMRMKSTEAIAIRTLRSTLSSIDRDLPAFIIKTYDEKIARNSAGIGFGSKIFLIFGVVGLILASSGIYGVMSNTVVQKTQEIGVRRALGANESRITKEFLMIGLKQLLWGVVPGLLAGGGLGFAMSSLMGTGTITLAIISITIITVISIVVMLATYLPTKRVLELEPSMALHYQ